MVCDVQVISDYIFPPNDPCQKSSMSPQKHVSLLEREHGSCDTHYVMYMGYLSIVIGCAIVVKSSQQESLEIYPSANFA